MTFAPFVLPRQTALDDNASPLSGAKLYFYNAGTTTPRATYQDKAGATPHANPVVADAAGRWALIFLDPAGGDYKVGCKTSGDVTIYTIDNIPVTPMESTSSSGGGATVMPVIVKISSYTVAANEVGKTHNCNPTSGDITVTMLSAGSVDDGDTVTFRHSGTAGAVIFSGLDYVMTVPGQTVTYRSDLVHWVRVDDGNVLPVNAQGWMLVTDRLSSPPTAPSAGAIYLAAASATGGWTTGRVYVADGTGGWIEHVPASGWSAWITDEGVLTVYNGSAWVDWSNVTAPTSSALKVAIWSDEKTTNTSGGTSVDDTWTTHALNTERSNTITGASLASNQITLPTGKYRIDAQISAYAMSETQIRLYSVTNSTVKGTSVQVYTSNFTSAGASILSGAPVVLSAYIDVTAASEVFALQYYTTVGGVASSLGRVRNIGSETEVYALVTVLDLASIQGPRGADGPQGSDGLDAAYPYQWSTSTSGDPGSGKIAGNNATIASITQIAVSETDSAGGSMASVIATWDDSTSTNKATIKISKEGATQNFHAFRITGAGTDQGAYWTFPVSYIQTSGTISNGTNCAVLVVEKGDKGDAGATGAAGAHSFDFTFDTGTSAADPGSGKVRANNANLASATALYINETDRLGVSQATAIAQWDDSTSTVRGFLTLVDLATPANKVRYSISGTNTDNGSYDTVNVTYVSGVTSLSAVNIAILFEPKGDQGTAGSGSGDLLSTNNLSDVASRATSRQNLGVKFVELEDYGGAADGTTDNTTPLNNAMAALSGLGIRNIRLRPGTYRFASKPSDLTLGVIIEGQGPSNTFIKRDYSGASSTTGFLVWSGSGANGGGIRDCQVYAATGTTTGAMLKFYTGAADPAGYQIVDNVVVTYNGTGTYDYSLLADGVLNTTSGSQGIRDLRILDTFLFKGASGTDSARFVNSTNLQTHGLWANGNVTVTGGGTATSNTTNANIDMICLAQLFVSEAKYITARGSVDTVNFSTNSQQCTWLGVVQTTSGGIADTGTDNVILNYNALGVAYGGTGARTASAARTNLGLVIGTDVQAYDADLAALAANSSNGLWARTGAGTGSARTITAPAAGITVSNGDGVSGNPTLALANDLSAVEGLASNGIATRTATDTWTARTITGTSAEITVTNGDGVSGNPTLSLPTALTFTGKTVTGGTFNVALGSVSAPSLSFSGDTDTGIYSSGANLLDFATAGVRRAGFTGSTMQFGVIASQAGALISVRDNAAALEWGHQNSAGYLCVLGNETGSGKPFMAWNCYAGTTANTYHTLGIAGVVFLSGNDGSVSVNAITNTSADNQSPTEFLSLGTGGVLAKAALGYKTGVGGSVTQATSRSTGVTINTPTGAITLVSAAGSTTATTFTVTNSYVAATDTIILGQKSGTDKYILLVTNVAAGSFAITAYTTGGTTTEQPVINFAVLKAVAS